MGDAERLRDVDRAELTALREQLLDPFGVSFDAPDGVALHLFGREDPRTVVQNFTEETVVATLAVDWELEERLTVPGDAETSVSAAEDGTVVEIGPRSLVVL